MQLATLIEQEHDVSRENIMFLRHSKRRTDRLVQFGASLEEYTAVQDEAGKYDFLAPSKTPIIVVVVIADDRVHAVYRVRGVIRKGPRLQISSLAYSKFSESFGKPNTPSILFDLEHLDSGATGAFVRGWTAPIQAVLRGGETGMFAKIEVDATPIERSVRPLREADAYERELAAAVHRSMTGERNARLNRLRQSPRMPRKLQVVAHVFERNADVIAEALFLARGKCGGCGNAAPFIRASDGTPYLEVHHRVPLSRGGEDTVENAVALCPNCHRQRHHGAS